MKKYFKYVVLAVILFIPFIYSFFYLKAYWNPYGEGNIDNIPVAVVNDDKGDKGSSLVKSIKGSKKLRLTELSKDQAENGLFDGKYYAIISIPETFSDDLNSASTTNKRHATVTYSPNQKANFLASQIINSVVNAVEKNLDNEVNSAIVDNLSKNIEAVPSKLDTISSGFGKLKDGTSKLFSGSVTLSNGASLLNDKFNEFNSGISTLKDGTAKLKDGSDKLSFGLKNASDGTSKIKSALDFKIEELKNDNSNALTDEQIEAVSIQAKNSVIQNEANIKAAAMNSLSENSSYQQISNLLSTIKNSYIDNGITSPDMCVNLSDVSTCDNYLTVYPYLQLMKYSVEETAKTASYNASLATSSETAKTVALNVGNMVKNAAKDSSITSLSELSNNIGTLNNGLNQLSNGAFELSSGIHSLFDGTNRLNSGSIQLKNGIGSLNSGASALNNGINTLDNSVLMAKKELDSNIENTKENIKKVDSLSEYSKSPVKVNTKEVNKVDSYGTSFSPLFISIGLWIGCLMMFMVLYYDKEERFGVFGINSNDKVKQIFMYHGLISLSSVLLGMLLHVFLGFNISNLFVYYLSLLVIGNTFMGIIEFLILTFSDIGKFIALILLVLQLAASGGTFPIETVTKGFRWLNEYLPMTYTINLLKESLMGMQNNLFINNFIIVCFTGVFFLILNVLLARLRQNKLEDN